MPIQFPPSPSLNQEYTYEGKVWAWDGSSWVGVRQETGIQKSNIWAKQNLLIPKRGFGLNSGYNGTTDQRRTAAGTIPSQKHFMERDLGAFVFSLLDVDAQAYITAVQTADSQSLEDTVKTAINNFVVGCKDDGIWNAMKASCILAGARTLTGALVPLKGTAPTNVNFVSGDYSRKFGLVGDGNIKYLDSNRLENADPQNSIHTVVYLTTASSTANKFSIFGSDNANATGIYGDYIFSRNISPVASVSSSLNGFAGLSRSSATTTAFIRNGVAGTTSIASNSSNSSTTFNLFRSPTYTANTYHSNCRMAFYSIGEALDLALFNTRVTTLINAYSAAIA
jgi:hypothetical protein